MDLVGMFCHLFFFLKKTLEAFLPGSQCFLVFRTQTLYEAYIKVE